MTTMPAPVTPAVGRVALVGAGPGSADLITVRGARRLAEAELVLYDALASLELRQLAPGARWFYVGKRACRQSIQQEVLNRLLIKYARRGLRVVRLKCGDPYVFGRGGEEALALARAGVPFEVIPGVSTAVAAPALAGIPVTHRGLASSYAVITGHHEATFGPLLDGFVPGSLTLVVLIPQIANFVLSFTAWKGVGSSIRSRAAKPGVNWPLALSKNSTSGSLSSNLRLGLKCAPG